MTAPYTPDTDEVRDAYAKAEWETFGNDLTTSVSDINAAREAFDRWLLEHDKKVAARSLRGWAAYQEHSLDVFAYCVDDDDRAETKAWCDAARLYADQIEHPRVIA